VPNSYDRAARYVAYLLKDIRRSAALFRGRKGKVTHLHFGGGSPNMLSADAFHKVMDAIEARFDFIGDAERAIELDPRGLRRDRIAAYAARGFSRASIGVQDLDPDYPGLFNVQDNVALAGQGKIVDRSKDRLGQSDKALIVLRKLWERELRCVAEGRAPKAWRRPTESFFQERTRELELAGAIAAE
jgi:hypothetical protein